MASTNPVTMDQKQDTPKPQPTDPKPVTTSRDSSFPVELPADPALFLPDTAFASYTDGLLQQSKTAAAVQKLKNLSLLGTDSVFSKAYSTATSELPPPYLPRNMTLTENAGLAYLTTDSPLLDLFTELEKTVTGDRLDTLLKSAWAKDPLTTLSIIWHARSIHLGKGEHESFYRCLGWLYQYHPKTLLLNLPVLIRRIIAKKKTEEEDEEMVMVEEKGEDSSTAQPEIRYGVSHGYWKDLLNILVLAAKGSLAVLDDPRKVLNAPNPQRRSRKKTEKVQHRRLLRFVQSVNRTVREEGGDHINLVTPIPKHNQEDKKHKAILESFQDVKYRALHLTVARLFATQLKKDRGLLASTDKKVHANISLAAKWAPSLEKFHDRHTCIASTVAELLFPEDSLPHPATAREGESHRTAYLRTARERYRAEILSPLRKFLEIVEIPISADAVHTVDYNTVPSLAMQKYKELFAMKDFSRFSQHVMDVAQGKGNARMSGAVLQPATLVAEARATPHRDSPLKPNLSTKASAGRSLQAKKRELELDTLDAQWQSLVRRIKGAGSLDSVIAVADVSGSMGSPSFNDKTTPMDTAIGMALLIAEVAPPPFGGSFITFSKNPAIVEVGGENDTRGFAAKVRAIEDSNWSMNTDFGAVFMKLLLPMALKHQVKPEDMVKTIVVLSDMQFDAAENYAEVQGPPPPPYTSTQATAPDADPQSPAALAAPYCGRHFKAVHESIREAWQAHGYELPTLVYWNLCTDAGARPVTGDTDNTVLVSGYSQGLLRGFMESGGFDAEVEDDAEEADAVEVTRDADGDVTGEQPKKKRRIDPTAGLKRAVEHPAYRGLRVVD